MDSMGLSVVVGPAHVGKVALLLERYLDMLDRDPWLVVPNRVDVDRIERDLVQRRPALLSGTVGTFDDLFRLLAGVDPFGGGTASEIQRTFAARRAVARAELPTLGTSAATAGFADTLLQAISEVESALADPESLDGELSELIIAYRSELSELGLLDRDGMRRLAVERLRSDLEAWSGAPVFAYGFEDLTGVEWALLEALSARTDVTVSIPYEPGRAAFEALERTVEDLVRLANGRIEELPRAHVRPLPPALAQLERGLFADEAAPGPPLEGAIRFLEGAGTRGTVELLASEVGALLRGGLAPERVAIVCDSPERWRAPLGAALGQLSVPFAVEHGRRLGDTAMGRALLSLLRYAWLGGTRGDLFAFLRSPFSALERRSVDFVEGRLRGRAVAKPERVDEESERLRGAHIPALAALRATEDPVAAVRELVESMMRSAWGLEAPPVADHARDDARAERVAIRTLGELDVLVERGTPVTADDVVAALERTWLAPDSPTAGRVAVLDHEHARTRAFDVVFVLGLEEGTFPRRARPSPLLADELRHELGGRLERPDAVARDRYLFYTTCTRAAQRLVLVREAAGDEGSPREPSPFWHDVRGLFDDADVQRAISAASKRRATSSQKGLGSRGDPSSVAASRTSTSRRRGRVHAV